MSELKPLTNNAESLRGFPVPKKCWQSNDERQRELMDIQERAANRVAQRRASKRP